MNMFTVPFTCPENFNHPMDYEISPVRHDIWGFIIGQGAWVCEFIRIMSTCYQMHKKGVVRKEGKNYHI